jgi:ATP-dependent Clp protease adaptor protein ClpS
MATTVSRPRKAPEKRGAGPGSGRGRPWLVIVRNDDHNTFDGVAFALARTIPGVTFERGIALADTIHTSGKAVVWTGDKERAELYWEQLAGFGLTMAPLTPAG